MPRRIRADGVLVFYPTLFTIIAEDDGFSLCFSDHFVTSTCPGNIKCRLSDGIGVKVLLYLWGIVLTGTLLAFVDELLIIKTNVHQLHVDSTLKVQAGTPVTQMKCLIWKKSLVYTKEIDKTGANSA